MGKFVSIPIVMRGFHPAYNVLRNLLATDRSNLPFSLVRVAPRVSRRFSEFSRAGYTNVSAKELGVAKIELLKTSIMLQVLARAQLSTQSSLSCLPRNNENDEVSKIFQNKSCLRKGKPLNLWKVYTVLETVALNCVNFRFVAVV